MKYQKQILFILILIIVNVSSVNAITFAPDEIESNTYVIGNHLFTRDKVYDINGNLLYKGALSTDYIMLASKSIESDNIDDMIIYYKSIVGTWKNAITNEVIAEEELPSTFEIDYINGRFQGKYEAENALLENNSIVQEFFYETLVDGYSGNGFVGEFANVEEGTKSSLTFSINVPSDDTYDLILFTSSPYDTKYNTIMIDDSNDVFVLETPKSTSFMESKYSVYLTKGEHNVKIIASDGNIYVDYLLVKGHTFQTNNVSVSISPKSNTQYFSLVTDNVSIEKMDDKLTWVNNVEYNDSSNKGSSKLTYKVDKNFIGNEDSYYDITIEYYDEGDSSVLLQSSIDSANTPNYTLSGVGGYVEESWWTWGRGFYSKNLAFGLTNTKKWKTYTFEVTDDFFEDNVDNYLNFYFGKETKNNENESVKVSKITINKRLFKIDSIDKNTEGNIAVVGNIYTNEDFGMGFSVKNTSAIDKDVNISYSIIDENLNVLVNEDLSSTTILKNESKKVYIKSPKKYGTFNLIVKIEYDGVIEEEVIDFSMIVCNLSEKNNDFLGLNTHFGYSGWANNKHIEESIKLRKKIGVNSIRNGVNEYFINSDKASGMTEEMGRYSSTFNSILKEYKQDLLINVWEVDSQVVVGNDGIIDSDSFKILKENINDIYSTIATEYGDYITYYEILNEWNYFSPSNSVTPEQYAEIVIEVSKVIKKIDSDAKIVAFSSGDDIFSNNIYTKYSMDSWISKVLATAVTIDYDDDGNNESIHIYDVIDVISLHPYTFESKESPDGEFSLSFRINEFRKLLSNYTSKKIPIWISEIGYETSSLGITELQQAAYITRTLIWGLANNTSDKAYIEKMYIYSFQNEATFNTNDQANLGIVNGYKDTNLKPFTRNVEMSAKSAYVAMNNFSYLLNNAKLVDTNEESILSSTDFSNNNYYYWYKFVNDSGNTIITAWNNNEETIKQNISLNVPKGNVVIYDMYGNILNSFSNENDTISLDISYKPVYIVVSN